MFHWKNVFFFDNHKSLLDQIFRDKIQTKIWESIHNCPVDRNQRNNAEILKVHILCMRLHDQDFNPLKSISVTSADFNFFHKTLSSAGLPPWLAPSILTVTITFTWAAIFMLMWFRHNILTHQQYLVTLHISPFLLLKCLSQTSKMTFWEFVIFWN